MGGFRLQVGGINTDKKGLNNCSYIDQFIGRKETDTIESPSFSIVASSIEVAAFSNFLERRISDTHITLL